MLNIIKLLIDEKIKKEKQKKKIEPPIKKPIIVSINSKIKLRRYFIFSFTYVLDKSFNYIINRTLTALQEAK